MMMVLFTINNTVWARQQATPNLGKPEIHIGAPSSNNLEHRLSVGFGVEFTTEPYFLSVLQKSEYYVLIGHFLIGGPIL